MGREPEDVAYNMDMQLMLRKKNERYYEINKKQITERAVKLEAAGKYITLLNRGKFHCGWQPNWFDKVHTVVSTDSDKVKDIAGQDSLTRNALPIASFTEVEPARQIESVGNVETDRRQRTLLQPFVDIFYYGNQGKRVTLSQASGLLDRIPGLRCRLFCLC